MSARLLATFCLISVGFCARAESKLVVYLKTGPAQPAAPVAYMKRELTSLMRSAGYKVEWGGEINSDFLAVVELSGNCFLPAGYAGSPTPAGATPALANTNVTDGRVLPFATVDCAAVTRSLSSVLSRDAASQRDFYYGRALARVIAHELYHILMRTQEHSRNGVSRPCFSTADLVAERFEFEGAVLAQLRARPQNSSTAVADAEDATDRQ